MRIEHLEHNGVGYQMATPDELLAAGVPQAAIDAAIADVRLEAIKAECRRRIYSVASQEAQMNVATAAAAASAKTASARSADETAILAGTAAGIGWVAAMRDAITPLAANPDADFAADAAWPDCPPEALAVYGQF